MVMRSTGLRMGARIALLPFVLAFAGCAADDIELNGKIFDAVGLNTSRVKSA